MQKQDKLLVRWSKRENDIEFCYPLGIQTGCDARYLNNFFTDEFIEQMTKRGYDITSLKFEISPLLPNEEKFQTLTDKYFK